MMLKKYLVFSLLLVFAACDSDEYETRFSVMEKVTPPFNNIAKGLNEEDINLVKESFKQVDAYIRSERYLAWRNSLEVDAQEPYRDMEKRIFNIGAAIDEGFGAMRSAYKRARINCMNCHYKLRTTKRAVLNQEVTPLKRK